MLRVVLVVALVRAPACKKFCTSDADCKLDQACLDDSTCGIPTFYTCDGDTVVATQGDEEVERIDCTAFLCKCGAVGEQSWCVRPNAQDACHHIYTDCGFVFITVDDEQVSFNDCHGVLAPATDCVLGCLDTAECTGEALTRCFSTPNNCVEPPLVPGSEPSDGGPVDAGARPPPPPGP